MFSRKCLQDIRFLARCPWTEWVVNFDACTCRTPIALLHVTIDDLAAINQPFLNNVEEILDRFERTYAHLQTAFPWFFRNSKRYDFLLFLVS